MTAIQRTADDFIIDADLLAEAFKLTQDEIRQAMHDGRITSRCETGIDEDAGQWRLTFYHGDRLCRFIVDEAGNILKKTAFPIKPRRQEPAIKSADADHQSSGPNTDA